MEKKIISKILAVVIGVSVFATGIAYSGNDTEYTDAIDFITSTGIMEGDENGNLNLDDTITRAELLGYIGYAY